MLIRSMVGHVVKQHFKVPPMGIGKQGFEIPVDAWLRGPLRETFESAVFAGNSPIGEWLRPGEVRRLYDRHLARVGRHGQVLWSILVLATWADRWLRCPVNAKYPIPRMVQPALVTS